MVYTLNVHSKYCEFFSYTTSILCTPSDCPNVTLSPGLTVNVNPSGASKINTIDEPKLKTPMWSPLLRTSFSVSCLLVNWPNSLLSDLRLVSKSYKNRAKTKKT